MRFSLYNGEKDFDRPAWGKLVKRLRPGDLLIVKSIGRLGRNYAEILEQWRASPKRSARTCWWWICRSWTPGRGASASAGPRRKLPPDFWRLVDSYKAGEIRMGELERRCGMTRTAIRRRLRQREEDSRD